MCVGISLCGVMYMYVATIVLFIHVALNHMYRIAGNFDVFDAFQPNRQIFKSIQ